QGDQVIFFCKLAKAGNDAYFRRIEYYDEERDRVLVFLTSHRELAVSEKNFLPPTILACECRRASPTLSLRRQTASWAGMSNNSSSAGRCSITYNSRTGPPGLRVTTPSSSDSVRYTRRRGLRSMSTPVKISSTATVAVRVAI